MLTRTGYLVSEGPIQEIKKQLTVRPIVNGDYGFPPPPFKVLDQLRTESAFQDSMELLYLENPKKTKDQTQSKLESTSLVPSETQPTKMRRWPLLFKPVTESFRFPVDTGKQRYHWR